MSRFVDEERMSDYCRHFAVDVGDDDLAVLVGGSRLVAPSDQAADDLTYFVQPHGPKVAEVEISEGSDVVRRCVPEPHGSARFDLLNRTFRRPTWLVRSR